MNQTTQQTRPTAHHPTAKRWIPIILILAALVLTANWITPVQNSFAAGPENFQVNPSTTPTATAAPTRTSQPPAAQASAAPAGPEATIMVSSKSVNLRTGPGTNFIAVRRLASGDQLFLLGRLSDSAWLFVRTPDGQEGWIETVSADLSEIDIDFHPIQTPTPFPATVVKSYGDGVNLRLGPSTVYEKVGQLKFGEKLMLLGRSNDNSWVYVKTSEDLQGWVEIAWIDFGGILYKYMDPPVHTPPPTPTSTRVVLPDVEGHWIDIDLSEQTLYAYDGTELVASFLVSTGIDNYFTEAGKFRIQSKHRYSDMHGVGYFLPDVPWVMYYDGDFSIHGTYWHHSFGRRMSRGCVNMDISDAEWLFAFSEVGTLVNIHR